MKQRQERHNRYTKIRNLHELRLEKMKLRELVINQESILKDDYQTFVSKFSFLSVLLSLGNTIVESFTIFNGLKIGMKVFSSLFNFGKRNGANK